ncbi:MAG: gamma-glutamylcyclotransferase family protein [Sumerlaeia bacterium]
MTISSLTPSISRVASDEYLLALDGLTARIGRDGSGWRVEMAGDGEPLFRLPHDGGAEKRALLACKRVAEAHLAARLCIAEGCSPPDVIRVFVYGSLKPGYWNFQIVRRHLTDWREAVVQGELYDGPGFPYACLPPSTWLATGTPGNAAVDLWLPECLPLGAADEAERPERRGEVVHGYLFTLADPEQAMAALDRLEGFIDPVGRGRNHYERVLVPAFDDTTGERCLAWSYTAARRPPAGSRLWGGRWGNFA